MKKKKTEQGQKYKVEYEDGKEIEIYENQKAENGWILEKIPFTLNKGISYFPHPHEDADIAILKIEYAPNFNSIFVKNNENDLNDFQLCGFPNSRQENVEGENYDVQEYLSKITNALIEISTKNIQLNLDAKNINLNIDTMLPIGILINELMSNSLKHAIINDKLIIDFKITLQKSNISIIYKDSGTTFIEKTNSTITLNIISLIPYYLKHDKVLKYAKI